MTAIIRLHGRHAKAKVRRGAARGVRVAGEHLLGRSAELVPQEEGTLERSGAVTMNPDGSPEVAVSYDTPYAVRQHEELTWRHDPGREAKYLEKPLAEDSETLLALIARDVGGELA